MINGFEVGISALTFKGINEDCGLPFLLKTNRARQYAKVCLLRLFRLQKSDWLSFPASHSAFKAAQSGWGGASEVGERDLGLELITQSLIEIRKGLCQRSYWDLR